MAKSPDERLKEKRALILAYKNIFRGKDAELVLEDLRKRLYYDYPTYTRGDSPKDGDIKEGMRIAFLHIKGRINYNMDNLKLTQEDE
jgi:hypothetical protein